MENQSDSNNDDETNAIHNVNKFHHQTRRHHHYSRRRATMYLIMIVFPTLYTFLSSITMSTKSSATLSLSASSTLASTLPLLIRNGSGLSGTVALDNPPPPPQNTSSTTSNSSSRRIPLRKSSTLSIMKRNESIIYATLQNETIRTSTESLLTLTESYKRLHSLDESSLLTIIDNDDDVPSSSISTRNISLAAAAACILIKDENHRLSEWIAYHYFVLPLRRLVTMIDPTSTQNPIPILDKWRPLIHIDVWNDTDINFKIRHDPNNTVKTHRGRQIQFYKECAYYLQEEQRQNSNSNKANYYWTAFWDVDEYIRIDPMYVSNARNISKEPGHILKVVHNTYNDPKLSGDDNLKNPNTTCLPIPRSAYGAKESSLDVLQQPLINYNEWLNGSKLETIRFQYRAHRQERKPNGHHKSFLNVQYLPRRIPTVSLSGAIDNSNKNNSSSSSQQQQ